MNQPAPPTIKQLNELFMQEGVRLSVNACKKAIQDWGGSARDITHMVSTTCTNSANPGFDHYVAKQLGIQVESILLAGVGCSGGLAAMRVAASIAMGSSHRRRPARVLVLACEISSIFVRSELESIHKDQEVRVGVCLFSDAASACIVSNGIGNEDKRKLADRDVRASIYSITGWKKEVVHGTDTDLGFDVDPLGWKVVLTPRVPSLTASIVPVIFADLVASIPHLREMTSPSDFDWALHPGGSLILSRIQESLRLEEHHLRASYEVYVEHGNSSSATIISVLDRLRQPQHEATGRKDIIACAFGPGINVEMMALRRGRRETSSCKT